MAEDKACDMTSEQQVAIREEVARAADPMGWAWYCRAPDDHPAKPVFYACATKQADAAIAAHLKALEAAGLVLVSIEPTDEMLDAGYLVSEPIDGAIAYAVITEIYRAMIDKRPQ